VTEAIRRQYTLRRHLHRSEKALTLQIRAMCRGFVGGDKVEADKLYARIAKEDPECPDTVWGGRCSTLFTARAVIAEKRRVHERGLARAVEDLPIHDWWCAIPGLGPLGLAILVGEAGDLTGYPNPGKLWKRMGVGRVEEKPGEWASQGRRQNKALAKLHGYRPSRRGALWTIGDSLIKKPGPYRELYLSRKELERQKDPEARPFITHQRAQRYMEKRLLRNAWQMWCQLEIAARVGNAPHRTED
jgi:hypothetical protein